MSATVRTGVWMGLLVTGLLSAGCIVVRNPTPAPTAPPPAQPYSQPYSQPPAYSAGGAEVYVQVDPPAPRVEPIPRARPGWVWVPGHWEWRAGIRRYDWVPGHWMRARRGYAWVPGHWERRPGGWIWINGYWR